MSLSVVQLVWPEMYVWKCHMEKPVGLTGVYSCALVDGDGHFQRQPKSDQ